MTQKITSTNIETSTLISLNGPSIANVSIANSTYVILDDTAVSNAGGYAVITGNNFVSGVQVLFGNTAAPTVTFVDSTRLNVQVPALTAGSYIVYVQNPDGSTAIRLNGITSSPIPVWSTGSTLTSQDDGFPISISLSASSDTSVTYTLANGSSLPSGTTLASNGLFSGTITGLSNDTTYNFTVNAVDAENQDTSRSFSVTVTAGDTNFKDTVLLLNGETRNNTWITDLSSNAFSFSVTGNTRPTALSPYKTVWSNFFDGTGDYLTIADAEQFEMNGDFTVEAWFYMTATPGTFGVIVSKGASGVYQPYYISVNSSNNLLFYSSSDGVSWDVASAVSFGTVSTNVWYHVAVSRQGSSIRLFLNGNLITTINNSNALFNNTRAVAIGGRSDGTELFTGYISNVRILQGLGLYTSSFTPSTSPLSKINNTVLLTCNSNRLIDSSNNAFTVSKTGDVFVSNFGPFVETDVTTGSTFFDGSGDFLTLTNFTSGSNNAFAMGTGDFTIEWWMYCSSYVTSDIIGISPNGWTIIIYAGDLYFQSGRGSGSLNNYFTISTYVPVNTWGHFAYVKTGSTGRFYANGIQVGTPVSDTTDYAVSSTDSVFIGGAPSPAYGSFLGHISNMRITKGVSVYTGNFTPPNQPLTISGTSSIYTNTSNVNTSFSSASTSLLTMQSRIGENNNRMIDISGFNHPITRSGNTSSGTFSPYQRGGWSNYFDGTGDYLTTPSSSLVTPTGNFTIEAWVYPNTFTSSNSGGTGIVFIGNSTSNDGRLQLWTGTDGSIVLYLRNNSASDVTTVSGPAGSIILNSWNHIAGVRNENNYTLYVNGTSVGNTTSATVMTYASNVLNIGFVRQSNFLHYWNGYISNLRLVNGTALYTSTFTPPTLPLTAIANTSILTCADNAFIDESPNNFTLTRNGDVSVQPFSPFKVHTITANTHSVYFDGTGDYLTIPSSSAFGFGTGDFTIEFWAFMQSRPNTWRTFFDMGVYTTGILMRDQATPDSLYIAGTSYDWMPNTYLALNKWNHVALTRSGTTLRVFVNGTAVLTTTNSSNLPSPLNLFIGESQHASGQTWPGYISNFRVVKGVAVYTGNFAVPNVGPLQLSGTLSASAYSSTTNVNTSFAAANTSLLTCASNTIIDLSTANTGNVAHSITSFGNTRPMMVNPLGFTVTELTGLSAEYSVIDDGGSMYFDGTGDFLTLPANTNLSFGTSNFTVEAWIYVTSTAASNKMILNRWTSSAADAYQLFLRTNNRLCWQVFTQNSPDVAALDIPINSWTHVAWTKVGNSAYLFINGFLADTSTLTNSANGTGTNIVIGADQSGTSGFFGNISGLRVIKGVALYTSAFVPPTTPTQPIPGTSLLINGINAGIINYSRKNNLETVGDVRIRNNIKKYGNTSIYFDGTGDYLLVPSSPNLDFGTGDFTIEMWVNFTNATSAWQAIISRAYGVAGGWRLYKHNNDNQLRWYHNLTSIILTTNSDIASGVWSHIAVVRSSGTLTIYINGTSRGSASDTNSYNPGNYALEIGSGVVTSAFPMTGYIDDLRITKGVARYTANFTPPTSAFKTK